MGPFDNFFSQNSPYPELSQPQANNFLEDIGDSLLGGLGYIGRLLDKPGRAVRGVLNTLTSGDLGSLREGLAVLPFSDSLGITNERNRISGTDLLNNLGAGIEKEAGFFDPGNLAGLATEIFTDPLAYLKIGPLTKAGEESRKLAATLPSGFTGRARGFDVAQSDLDRILQGSTDLTSRDLIGKGETIAPSGLGIEPRFKLQETTPSFQTQPLKGLGETRDVGTIDEALKAVEEGIRPNLGSIDKLRELQGFDENKNPLLRTLSLSDPETLQLATSSVERIPQQATQLGNTLGFSTLPFGFGGMKGIDIPFIDRNLDALGNFLKGSQLGTAASRLFDTRVGNVGDAGVQQVQREVGAPGRDLYRREAMGSVLDLRRDLQGGLEPLINAQNEKEAMRFLRQATEVKDPFTSPMTGISYSPVKNFDEYQAQLVTRPAENPQFANRLEEMRSTGELESMAKAFPQLQKTSEDLGNLMQTFRASENATGMNSQELLDLIDYLPRQKNPLPRKPGEGGLAYANRVLQTAIKTKSENQIMRKEVLRNVPGGTNQIEDWLANPELRAMDPLQRTAYLYQELTGSASGVSPEMARLAKELGDFISSTQTGIGSDLPGAFNRFSEGIQGLGPGRSAAEKLNLELSRFAGPQIGEDVLEELGKRDQAFTQARGLEKYLRELPEEYGQGGKTLFNPDVLGSVERRGVLGAKAKASTDVVIESLNRFAKPLSEGGDLVPLRQVLHETNLTSHGQAAELLRRDLRLNNVNELDSLGIERSVANDLLKVQKAWQNPEEMRGLLSYWDWAMNMFKGAITYPFPAFHARNIGSGIYMHWLGDALDKGAMQDAFNVLTKNADLPYMSRDQLVKEAVQGRVAFTPAGRQVSDLAADAETQMTKMPGGLSGEGFRENLKAGAKANAPENWKDLGFIVREGKAAGNFVEDWLRLSHYLAKRKQGFAPEVAAQEVQKRFFDYTQATQFERNVMKRVIPFYSWSRNNLPLFLEEAFTNPAKFAESVRLTGEQPGGPFTPPYLSEGTAIPFGEGEKGKDRYLAGLGLPYEGEEIKALGNLAKGDLSRVLQQVLGTTAPPIKVPLELATGMQFHSGRKLSDLIPSATAQALGATAEGTGLGQLTPNIFNEMINIAPFSRGISTVEKLGDSKKDLPAKLTNFLTGSWITDVDANKSRSIEVRNQIEDRLRGDQGVTNWEQFYVAPENLAKLSPKEQELYMLYRFLDKQARDQAKERKTGKL